MTDDIKTRIAKVLANQPNDIAKVLANQPNDSKPSEQPIRVLRDFVAVTKVEPEKSSAIEIVRFDDRLQQGMVVQVGTGVLTQNGQAHAIEVQIGDHVVFDKMSAREVTHKGNKYLILNELSILCVLL